LFRFDFFSDNLSRVNVNVKKKRKKI
jgi:hypothetical protein